MAVAFHSDSIEIQEEEDYDDVDNATPEDDVKCENVETKTSAQRNPEKKSVIGRYKLLGLVVGLLCGVQALLNIGLRMSLHSEPIKELSFCGSPGWQTIVGRSYYISTENKTWNESRQWCLDRNSDLIIINSKDEQELVQKAASVDNRDPNVWLGLTDREEEGVWKWVDGIPLGYWRRGEPSNSDEGEDCAVHHEWPGRKGWNDLPCTAPMRWICEKVV